VTARQRRILHRLVEEHIRTKAPVPSARLAEALGLSPALARYELIALEEMGYLSKPHASAGRVPTRQAYRQYALSLLPPAPLPKTTQESLLRALEGAREPELFLVKMASGLSGYPALLRLRPKRAPKVLQIHLSPLPEGTLAVVVLEGGRVREVRLPHTLPKEKLREAEEALSRPFRELPEAPKGLEDLFAILGRALSAGLSLTYREGLAQVLKEPEAQDPSFLERLVRLYERGEEDLLTPPGRVDVRVGEVEGLAQVQAGLEQGSGRGSWSFWAPCGCATRRPSPWPRASPRSILVPMRVEVRLFALYREQAGQDRLHLDLPEGARVKDAKEALERLFPGLSLQGGMAAVNQALAQGETPLEGGRRGGLPAPGLGGAGQLRPHP
jgi:heat-inducible transcriptional repressor